jgi:hypothetical protein
VAVNCPKQVQPKPGNPNGIHMPSGRFRFQVSAQPAVYFRSVSLNPTPDRGVIPAKPRSAISSLISRRLRENLQYQRTQVTMMIGSN